MKITIVAGTRPNFIKVAPIIEAIRKAKHRGISYRFVHTGQHYDSEMNDSFFKDLNIPKPDFNLGCGGGSQAEQTAAIMVTFEHELIENPTDLVIVVGDVTSTMACSIVARKLCTRVAHVEGGLRSGDWTMPEEVNRVVTDSITNYFFTTSEFANRNLRGEGIPENRVFFVGNVMIDTLMTFKDKLRRPALWDEFSLEPGNYFVITLHRPANVDKEGALEEYLSTIENSVRGLPVIFPVHPRTARHLKENRRQGDNLHMVPPMGYLEFNYMVKHSKAVITDSGGITEETTVMGIPCLTLRDNTERPETVSLGTNELIGTDPSSIPPALDKLFAGKWKKGSIPELWDGKAAERIVDTIGNFEF